MSLKVHTVKRKVLAGENAGKELYYGQVRLNAVVPLENFSRRISANTTATPADVEAVINSLAEVVTEELDEGHSIDLGELGSMRLSAGSSGVETPEAFHCRLMRRPRVIFTPGKLLKDTLEETSFEWLRVRVNEVPEDCQRPHTV